MGTAWVIFNFHCPHSLSFKYFLLSLLHYLSRSYYLYFLPWISVILFPAVCYCWAHSSHFHFLLSSFQCSFLHVCLHLNRTLVLLNICCFWGEWISSQFSSTLISSVILVSLQRLQHADNIKSAVASGCLCADMHTFKTCTVCTVYCACEWEKERARG